MLHHHAFLLFGETIESSLIPQQFKKPSIDVTHIEASVLSIDDVRALIKVVYSQPFEAKVRTCVVCVHTIAYEAQQALLKVLEEPPASAQFYFVLRKTTMLLPTLRSRFSSEWSGSKRSIVIDDTASSFFTLPLGERLACIAEKTKEKDTAWIELLLQTFEVKAESTKNVSLLRSVVAGREAERSRGASVKMILEDLTLRCAS